MQLDLSSKDCIREVSNWGENVYYNICDGTQHVLPWGIDSYVLMGIMLIIFMFFFGVFSMIGYQLYLAARVAINAKKYGKRY